MIRRPTNPRPRGMVASATLSSSVVTPARAFTLTELLVVIIIISIVLALAVPTFRLLTGARSIDGAQNGVASMLGRARAEAVGIQTPEGLVFYNDPKTDRTTTALMRRVSYTTWAGTTQAYPVNTYVSNSVTVGSTTTITYYVAIKDAPAGTLITDTTTWEAICNNANDVHDKVYDVIADTERVPLSAGVGAQTVCNATFNAGGVRTSDGYLRIGMIVFDGNGNLSGERIVIAQNGAFGQSIGLANDLPSSTSISLGGEFGLVLYDREAYTNQGFPTGLDPFLTGASTYTSGGPPSEFTSEAWLDANATPLLINRYNGTLIKGE